MLSTKEEEEVNKSNNASLVIKKGTREEKGWVTMALSVAKSHGGAAPPAPQ